MWQHIIYQHNIYSSQGSIYRAGNLYGLIDGDSDSFVVAYVDTAGDVYVDTAGDVYVE